MLNMLNTMAIKRTSFMTMTVLMTMKMTRTTTAIAAIAVHLFLRKIKDRPPVGMAKGTVHKVNCKTCSFAHIAKYKHR